VIAAGAVVTESLTGGALYAGAPASLVRMLDPSEKNPQAVKEEALGPKKN